MATAERSAQESLAEAVDAVRALMAGTATPSLPPPPPGSPLAALCTSFGLDAFARGLLLLTVVRELHPGSGADFAALAGDEDRPWPTIGLALGLLPRPSWEALLPTAPLRARRLVRLGPGEVLTERAVHLEERVLHALMGADHLEPRLARRLDDLAPARTLAAGHAALADRLHHRWGRDPVHLWCEVPEQGRAIAAAAGSAAGRRVLHLPAGRAPTDPDDLEEFLGLWSRECGLGTPALVVDLDAAPGTVEHAAAREVARRADGPVVTVGTDPRPGDQVVRLRVTDPPFEQRLAQWEAAVAAVGPRAVRAAAPGLDHLAARFRLHPDALDAAVDTAVETVATDPRADLASALWDGARVQAHPRLEDLARRLPATASWADLVLPEPQRRTLRALAAQVRTRATVEHRWGFDARGPGGTSGVFAGPSGTGKTMAAGVLAADLGLDLFRVDLSAVVSKYIGETEKNLRRVFDAAESGGAVLLFDEADALFGKRTEVRDSHDRHANIEVSYLLARMETFTGLALLTTNHRDHLDPAFLRRISFVVDFPFPDATHREELWRRAFPGGVPVRDLDTAALARLSVAGGNVRSIARNAAALAADRDGPVTMDLVRVAAELEYAKLGRSLTPAEVRGWS